MCHIEHGYINFCQCRHVDFGTTLRADSNAKSSFLSMDDSLFLWIFVSAVAVALLFICIACALCHFMAERNKSKSEKSEGIQLVAAASDQKENDIQIVSSASMHAEVSTSEANEVPGHKDKAETGEAEAVDVDDPFSDSAALKMWLQSMDLLEYLDLFIEHGFAHKMSALKLLNNEDLKDMGISKTAHRKTILAQIANN